ncbi:hypothetical protein L9F63_002651 [Diploptera punctata]|uniref:WAP domain-containing protein n=1 Tax=Diploptera punctata TaxID=6984 RepID=A0AAD7ZRF6_DIPPU|nr:hypothetical protein L9F63_002651 [Diploptera punctata]
MLCSVVNLQEDDQIAGWLCPPPSDPETDPVLCDEPQCLDDADCIAETMSTEDNETIAERSCCYNGCVNTCIKRLEPPIEIDWLEEFRQNEDFNLLDEEKSEDIEPVPIRHHNKLIPQALTKLPGGCVLTVRQYEELESFRKHSHVEKCFCDKGGVSCEVTRKNLSQSDAS